jgi:hypothetical protein
MACPAKCYDLSGAPGRDASFTSTQSSNSFVTCLVACETSTNVQPLARVLVAGNTTYDGLNPLGNRISGVAYELELDSATTNGFEASVPASATAGPRFQILAQSSTSGLGGDIRLFPGTSNTSNGGNLILNAGQSFTSGNGGVITLQAGTASTGNGGDLTISAGGTTSGNGGGIFLSSGGTSAGGVGGVVDLSSGNTVNVATGDIRIKSGDVIIGAASAGDVIITGGSANGNAANTPGDIIMTPGSNTSIPALPGGLSGYSSSFGIRSTSADTATHFVAQQSTAPTVTVGAGLLLPGASDMAGQATIPPAAGADEVMTIRFNKRYPGTAGGLTPYVVVSPTSPSTIPIYVSSVDNVSFTVTSPNGNPGMAFNYHVIGSTFVL